MEELEVKIETLREKLNKLMGNREVYKYEDILNISIKLDKLIYEYYMLIKNKNRKCTE